MRIRRDERGAVAPAYTAIVTLASIILAGALVNRVAWTAESINRKAGTIQKAASSIKGDSTAVLNLDQTNASASSILKSAEPLDNQLKKIVSLAQAVDVKAKSINASASTVSGTAKDINNTAGGITGTASGINTSVAGILSLAQSIMRGVDQINTNLDSTISVVTAIRGDTGNIRTAADRANARASCVDGKLPVAAGLLGQAHTPDCRTFP